MWSAIFSRVIFGLLMATAAIGWAQPALAGTFPEKPVTLIVSWPAGGGTDVSRRAAAKFAEGPLGHAIVVVNKPGGGGVVGTLEVERVRPDAYTLLVCTSTTVVTQDVGNVHNDIKKLTPIAYYAMDAAAVTVRADAPWKTLKDFVEYAKANPGKLRNANSPAGGTSQIAASIFEKGTGTKLIQVPYGGFAPSVAALLGGHVDSTTVPVSDVAKHHQEGTLRVLAVMADKRHYLVPNVPTLKELAIDLAYGVWYGICAPAATPPAIVAVLERAFLKGWEHAEFKAFMEKSGWVLAPMGAKDTAALFENEDRRIHALLKEMGLTTK